MAFNKKPLLTAVLSVMAGTALADETKHHFDIPAQNLTTALQALANQSGAAMLYAEQTTQGKRSPKLQGDYATQAAVDKLLAGTGLTYQVAENGTVLIRQPERQGDSTLPTVNVVDKPIYNATDPNNPDYNRTNASTATKTDTPILETPYSVRIIPQQVLKDQQVIRVEDAITNVAGVQSSFTNGGDSDVFILRGFQNTNLYRDGFLLPSALGGGTLKRQTANLERIEVLKGPGSILFGRNEPGGVINLVTKRPQAESYHSIQQQFGSFDLYRTTADSTGAITQDESLLYRLNLSYENANSFRDFVKTDTFFAAPSFTWNVSERTQINLDIEYQNFDNTNDSGIPPIGNRPAPVPRNRQIGEPTNNKTEGDRTYFGVNWTHEFNDNWKLNHRFGAEFLDVNSDFVFFFAPATAEGNLVNLNADFTNDGNRGFNNGVGVSQQNYYTTLNLTGKFKTPGLEHTPLWGFDYFVIDNQQAASECCAAFPIGANFNIFNPTYLTSRPDLSFQRTNNVSDFTQNWYGVYFQDQIKFPFNIYGNFGLRYDNAETVNNNDRFTASQDDRISPRGGLLWKPLEWLAVYGNYSENFGPSNSFFRSASQQPLPPQTATEWELGAKTEFFDGRLSSSFAYFDLTRENVSVPDPVNPNLSVTVGEQESRGYEFEVAGRILPGWNIIGAYTHLAFANINRDVGFDGGPGDTGNRLFGAPRNFGSILTTYEFQSGSLQGFKVGGSVVGADQSQGRNQNDFQLPGYATLNLLASYGFKAGKHKVTLQLNANNLLDKTYYTGTNTGAVIGVGAPRNFLGSVRVEF